MASVVYSCICGRSFASAAHRGRHIRSKTRSHPDLVGQHGVGVQLAGVGQLDGDGIGEVPVTADFAVLATSPTNQSIQFVGQSPASLSAEQVAGSVTPLVQSEFLPGGGSNLSDIDPAQKAGSSYVLPYPLSAAMEVVENASTSTGSDDEDIDDLPDLLEEFSNEEAIDEPIAHNLGISLEEPPSEDEADEPPHDPAAPGPFDIDFLSPVSSTTFEFIDFILTCANGSGLSGVDVARNFKIQKKLGGLEEFSSAHALVTDIKMRHAVVHKATGGFAMVEIDYCEFFGAGSGKAKTGDVAQVRCVESTVLYIMSDLLRVLKIANEKEALEIKKGIVYEASVLFGKDFAGGESERLFGGPETADAFLRLQDRARREDPADEETISKYGAICILICYLFIDKHNTTKLNKRSLYAVVLFMKNLVNGRLRSSYSHVIAYIPYPTGYTDTGDKISDTVLAHLRRVAAHQTIRSIIDRLRGSRKIHVLMCPDGRERRFLISISNGVFDSPELKLQAGSRGGTAFLTGTKYPDPRCWLPRRDPTFFSIPDPSRPVQFRSAAQLRKIYRAASDALTKGEREAILKSYSLNEPRPAWLRLPDLGSRFEENGALEDSLNIEVPFLNASSGEMARKTWRIEKFDFHCIFPAEFMHNHAQGALADSLKQTTPYFLHFAGEACGNRLITLAPGNQVLLSRSSFPNSIFRIAAPGLSIAPSHANVSATEVTCFFTVMPLLLVGIADRVTSDDGKVGSVDVQKDVVLPLMRYTNALQRLSRFLDNENSSPFFSESDITMRLRSLQIAEDKAFRASLGKWLAIDRKDIVDIPNDVAMTIKRHVEFHHRSHDIRVYGNVQNDSAMFGEKSLAKDNRVQARTQRGSGNDPGKLAAQTAIQRHMREVGIIQRMYPVAGREEEDATGSRNDSSDGESDAQLSATVGNRKSPASQTANRKASRRLDLSAGDDVPDLDGVSAVELNELIRERADGPESGSGVRQTVKKLNILNSLTIDGKFPWLPTSLRQEHPDAVAKMSGLSQTLRASPIFHGRPIYDQALAIVGGKPHFVQIRLIFQVPPSTYADVVEIVGGALLLVRVLERCRDMRHLSKVAGTDELETHATRLQLSDNKEEVDRVASEKMRNWLANEVSSAQGELRDRSEDILTKELETDLRENVKWAEKVERALLEPVLMHEFGLDRLAYKLKEELDPIPNDKRFRDWAVLPEGTSKVTRSQPRRQGEAGQSSLTNVRSALPVHLAGKLSHPASKLYHAVIGVADVVRVVSIQPDCGRPVEILENGATSKKLIAEGVEIDARRYKVAEAKRQKAIKSAESSVAVERNAFVDMRQRALRPTRVADDPAESTADYQKKMKRQQKKMERAAKRLSKHRANVTVPAMTAESMPSPSLVQDLSRCRFFHNIHARLTRPG